MTGSDVVDAQTSCDHSLRAERLTVRYGDGALGAQDVSLEVRPGEILAIVGPNGAGKSSTLRGLGGFLSSERVSLTGTVSVYGQDVSRWEPHRRARLGLFAINERRKVFPNLTVRENLLAVQTGGDRRQRMARALDLFPLLGERLDAPAGLLSGGQQQMLAIGRGVMLNARVLLIDEMTLGIHASLRPRLFAAVGDMARDGCSIVVVDESVPLVMEHAHRIVGLENGHIVMQGTTAELRGSALLERLYSGAGT